MDALGRSKFDLRRREQNIATAEHNVTKAEMQVFRANYAKKNQNLPRLNSTTSIDAVYEHVLFIYMHASTHVHTESTRTVPELVT